MSRRASPSKARRRTRRSTRLDVSLRLADQPRRLCGRSREVRAAVRRFLRLRHGGRLKASIDPAAFTVVDGKLYLNYNRDVQKEWRKDIPGFVAKADRNWPAVAKQTKVIE